MPSFGAKSTAKLETADPRLIRVFKTVVPHWDCQILEGLRTPQRQLILFKEGKSKVDGTRKRSKHNFSPSRAIDAAPFYATEGGVVWPPQRPEEADVEELTKWHATHTKVVARYYAFAHYVQAVGMTLGIPIRLGADWNGNRDFNDQTFDDLVHFELIL